MHLDTKAVLSLFEGISWSEVNTRKYHNFYVNFSFEVKLLEWLRKPPGVLPYKGLIGTCGQLGCVFRDFCLKQSIEFIIFCLNHRNSVLNVVGKLAIFVLIRVRVWGAGPHLPTPGYIEYPPRRENFAWYKRLATLFFSVSSPSN